MMFNDIRLFYVYNFLCILFNSYVINMSINWVGGSLWFGFFKLFKKV